MYLGEAVMLQILITKPKIRLHLKMHRKEDYIVLD